jgi:S1-C subfamily serine protease
MTAPSTPESSSGLAQLSDTLAGAVERAGRSIATVSARPRQSASGILWRAGSGEIIVLTADHVVERDDEIGLTLPNGREVKAQLIGRDPSTDLAALRVAPADLGTDAVAAETSSDVKVGHLVLAIGRPGSTGLRASMGVVSYIEGQRRSWRGGEFDAIIYSDLTLYPGFSGGPLVDLSGRVVGLNSSRLTRESNTAIPVSTLTRVADSLLTHGRIRRGYLGVGTQQVPLPAALAQKAGITQDIGLLVISVEPQSPAEQGGLFIGDLIVSLAGQPVTDAQTLRAQLGTERVGQPLVVRVIRGGEPKDLAVTVGERS